MLTKRITFEEILPIWETKLWSDRESAIETHSAMVWLFSGELVARNPYDMSIFNYDAHFWGTFIDGNLVGVNSGHLTTNTEYRSRGIWVNPSFRGQGIAQQLLQMTKHCAVMAGAKMIWTMPRKTALSAYERFGFKTVGDFFKTETAESNIYAVLDCK
jgi:GNAT superfamily N-acetyltransferase